VNLSLRVFVPRKQPENQYKVRLVLQSPSLCFCGGNFCMLCSPAAFKHNLNIILAMLRSGRGCCASRRMIVERDILGFEWDR
jgi:hypothetical protein